MEYLVRAQTYRLIPIVETGDRFCDFAPYVASISDGFESFRGALVNNAGTIIFSATPSAGQLGVFAGRDPVANKLLSVGDRWLDSTVAGFALNPVSVHNAGQLAILLLLADRRQFIVRADPIE